MKRFIAASITGFGADAAVLNNDGFEGLPWPV